MCRFVSREGWHVIDHWGESGANDVGPDELVRRLRVRLNALGPAPRAELLRVLMLPEFDRAERIGEFWSCPQSRAFGELLIDCEEDRDAPGGAGRACCGRPTADVREGEESRASRRRLFL
jgi:hypothetical protein